MFSAVVLALSCYLAPVNAPVAVPFAAPSCTYCPGHRGLQYSVAAGTLAIAAASGTVSFVGVVVGTRYVVVNQDDGRTATYGMLAAAMVSRGARIAAGQAIATTLDSFYFGLRQGDIYIDPAPFIGTITRAPRLVPISGGAWRPARVRPPSCTAT
ncbi:MAG TPA: peptidoglycan DD-metalloendopeptidase family protein [Ilumatobacteraceae bacterium]|jgi:murein DD-endopeptidase MepM/ murein hydrolase activator NlpD